MSQNADIPECRRTTTTDSTAISPQLHRESHRTSGPHLARPTNGDTVPSALSEAAIALSRQPGRPCSVAMALADMTTTDPDSAADLQAWLRGEPSPLGDTDDGVRDALQKLGYRVGKQTVGRHRRRVRGYGDRCSCADTP